MQACWRDRRTAPLMTGEAVAAGATIQELARQLVDDDREFLPVQDDEGTLVGMLERGAALDLLLGTVDEHDHHQRVD